MTRPTHVRIDREQGFMEIEWADGTRGRCTLRELRMACPCALCVKQRETQQETGFPPLYPPQAFQLSHAELVGNYAINLIWADGHSQGIYQWEYLRSLCQPIPETEAAAGASKESG